MFFLSPLIAPVYSLLIIYVLAAVIPAAILMCYIYKKDRIEREPPWLLGSLTLLGVAAALVALVLEILGQSILDSLVSFNNPKYILLLAFLVVAAVE